MLAEALGPPEAKPDQAQSRRLDRVECNRSCERAGCFPVFQIGFENEPRFYTSATPSLSPKLVPPLLSGRRSYPRPRSPEQEGRLHPGPFPCPGPVSQVSLPNLGTIWPLINKGGVPQWGLEGKRPSPAALNTGLGGSIISPG